MSSVTIHRTRRTFWITALLTLQLAQSQACFAGEVSPSPRTRTLAAPLDNYFQQITKGHPYRWFDGDMAVRVLIKSGEGVPGYRRQFEESLRAAFADWENIATPKIRFSFVTESPADITCQFVSEFPKKEADAAGVTSYQTSPHHMDSAVISLKTNCNVRPLTNELMRVVCLHEIGHALGLVNHSLDPHDVMYPYLNSQTSLSRKDIKTIKLLYDFQPPVAILQRLRNSEYKSLYPFGLIVLSGADYDAYSRKVAAQLLKNFSKFRAGPILECSVRFFVDSNGNIHNYRMFLSSANEEFDQKALSSLISAVPFPPAPVNLQKNERSKIPMAMNFRSDGWIVPYVEPDPNQSDWLETNEEPSPDEMMKELDKGRTPSPKIIDQKLEPWIVEVTQKAHAAWKIEGKGKAELVMGIGKDGRISHLVVLQSSGNELFDNSVRDACMSAEPYPAAPEGSQDTTEVNLLFEQ